MTTQTPAGLTALLNKSEVCALLNVSPRTIENLCNQDRFPPPVRVGRHVYWSELAVQAWRRRLFAAQEAWHG